ncbi:MAG: hypothetical protein KKE51_09015 [Gammaproteobacteria bacterium]|nr:hypothetical protein [Gammaproteobacteria bacterium]MBU1602532.1 hypothetical protein [Gammaproteobacteria bacterium]MBU2433337.1 hypothetical protein [Gammaproteobacteria bacterium]MBU2451253.1 hypothetical protein [Gammaproteobacteria bacterium]
MSTKELRERWKAYWQEQEANGYQYTGDPLPPELVGMTCGGTTRAGTPCKQRSIYRNGRCKFHGGMATGPTTEAGKEQARINGRKGGRPRKASCVDAEALTQQGARLLKDVRVSEAAIETEIIEPWKSIVSKQIPGEELGSVPGHEMSTDVHVSAVHEQREIIPDKPKSMNCLKMSGIGEPEPIAEMSKDAHALSGTLHRCSDCRNLSANWICQAAARGEIEGGGEFRPVLSEPRNCQAFKHWKT